MNVFNLDYSSFYLDNPVHLSNDRLNPLLKLHPHPINLVVFKGFKKPNLQLTFPLICFQGLCFLHVTTRRCF